MDEKMEKMPLRSETKRLLARIVKDFENIKSKHFAMEKREGQWSSEFDSIIGRVWWNNPHLVWILVSSKEEDYEGSQTQVGVDKDGNLRWEYQSHCSCNSYEDTSDLPPHFHEDSVKSFDFTYTLPPEAWELMMIDNMKKLLKK